MQRLGAIVVDEEHGGSHKQGTAPHHARDVARVRAQLEGALLVLGSATPSLETLQQGDAGTVRVFALPQRIDARPLPPVSVVDLRTAPRVPEARGVPWSEALDAAVSETLAQHDQVILLLNRRGHSTHIQCPACGDVRECPRCAITLTLHQTPPALRCHSRSCEPVDRPAASAGTRRIGWGHRHPALEHFIALRFPEADRPDGPDTTSTKWAHHQIRRVARREVDILLGTQMIAGPRFSRRDARRRGRCRHRADLPDFRASERTFQLVAQVVSRPAAGPRGTGAGSDRAPGITRSGGSGALVREFAAGARCGRRRILPSAAHGLVRFIAAAEDPDAAARGRRGRRRPPARRGRAADALTVLGPAPCPIPRLKGRWRWHVLVKATEPRAIGQVVRAWGRGKAATARGAGERGPAVIVDRDPVTLL